MGSYEQVISQFVFFGKIIANWLNLGIWGVIKIIYIYKNDDLLQKEKWILRKSKEL